MRKTINTIRFLLDKTIPVISAMLFLICVLSTAYGTVNRTFDLTLNASWVEEVSIYSMIWSTALLIGHLLRKGMHTQFTLLIEKLKGKTAAIWKMMILLIEFAIFTILLIGGIQLTANGSRMFMSAIHITMFWAYLSVPVGSALVLLELIMAFIEELSALSKK